MLCQSIHHHPGFFIMLQNVKYIAIVAFVASLCAPATFGQGLDPTIKKGATVPVSDHVYMIPDEGKPIIPNVGIVVGERATLIIDSGLGNTNGLIVLEEARKVSKADKFYELAQVGEFLKVSYVSPVSDQLIPLSDIASVTFGTNTRGAKTCFISLNTKSGEKFRSANLPEDTQYCKDIRVKLMDLLMLS